MYVYLGDSRRRCAIQKVKELCSNEEGVRVILVLGHDPTRKKLSDKARKQWETNVIHPTFIHTPSSFPHERIIEYQQLRMIEKKKKQKQKNNNKLILIFELCPKTYFNEIVQTRIGNHILVEVDSATVKIVAHDCARNLRFEEYFSESTLCAIERVYCVCDHCAEYFPCQTHSLTFW